ncbi:MAG TPA: pyridoxal phosphate-dependent aminotransferase [Bacteroidales bacterium]|nr:pyridoxal phosphate-dependent aminotransferase [Bacteroidales bacterium]
MKSHLSNRINELAESETLAMMRISRELINKGYDVISLAIGEPDFDTPEPIKQAAIEAINNNFTHYTPVSGIIELRQAICRKLLRDNNLEYKPENIVVSTGAKQAIYNVIMCLVNPGDEVIIPSPYWVSYKEIIKLSEGKAIYIDTDIENDFKITTEQLEAAITPKTKMIIYSSPCNPSGSVYTKSELEAIALVLKKYPSIYIVSDEIYENINFTGEHYSIANFEYIKDRVILVNGVSKSFAMTGWRVGYIAAPSFVAQACDKLQGQVTSCTNSIAQKAAIAALDTDPKKSIELKSMLLAFKERRDIALKMLNEIPNIKTNIPQGAFYILPDVSYYFGKIYNDKIIHDANELCDYLLQNFYIALVPGDAFGNPKTVRISYAISKDRLVEAISRLKKGLNELK